MPTSPRPTPRTTLSDVQQRAVASHAAELVTHLTSTFTADLSRRVLEEALAQLNASSASGAAPVAAPEAAPVPAPASAPVGTAPADAVGPAEAPDDATYPAAVLERAWSQGRWYTLRTDGEIVDPRSGRLLSQVVAAATAAEISREMRVHYPAGGPFRVGEGSLLVTRRVGVLHLLRVLRPEDWFPGHLAQ